MLEQITEETIKLLARTKNNTQLVDSIIKKQYDNLTNKEREEIGKNYKKQKFSWFLVIEILSGIFFLSSLILLILSSGSEDQLGSSISGLMISVAGIIIGLYILNPKEYKKSDFNKYCEIKLRKELNKKIDAQKLEDNRTLKENRFAFSNIKKTILIDSYTTYSDKLHAILNYQEIIQTRWYKFKIIYDDNSSEVVDVKEESNEYDYLMKFIVTDSEHIESKQTSQADEIKKIKELYDNKAITEEEFEKMKNKIINKNED